MATNPYAPPTAAVTDVSASQSATPLFFPVSTTKLLVLSVCTLGLYELYWFYMNWRIVKERTNEKISPFWRAFFAIFFCYSLFSRVRKEKRQSSAASLAAGPLATVWIILSILWKLPDPFWLVTYAAVLALLPVQKAINEINRSAAPAHDPNVRFTPWNWIAVAIGGPLMLMAIYGTLFLPP